MNYDRVHALFSKATEAIVSEDGKVKRRLNNYETVVGKNTDDPFYIPSGAVNDNYGNLNYQNTDTGGPTDRIDVLRYAMYTTIGLVILGFIWSLYTFISPTAESISDNTDYRAHADTDPASTGIQLERIANLVIRDGDWSKTRVELFLRQWHKLDFAAQEDLKNKAWHQHFTYRLKNRFEQERLMGTFARQAKTAPQHPLMELALALGVASPKINYALEDIQSPDDIIYKQLVNEVSTELARVEEAKRETISTSNSGPEPDTTLTAQLMEQLAVDTPQPVSENSAATSKTNAATPEQQVVTEQVQAPVTITTAPEPSISELDVALVLQKYSTAYAQGDIQELSTLFGVNDSAEGDAIVAQLKANYENVFANSHKRSVTFNGLNWRFQGDTAIVNSDYNAELELNNNKGLQTVTANAQLALRKTQDQLRIASFELLNRKVNVVTPEINLSSISSSKPEKVKPIAPTAAELQDIVTRLVSAYESGDLKTFTSLFTPDAKTNDRSDLNGIRQDYQELFASSNDRQMFIQGMKWQHSKNHAKGSGDLEALVLSESGDAVYAMTGKIQIVAQRVEGKVLITHLYHLERTN